MKRERAPGPRMSWVRALPGRLRGVSGRILASGRIARFLAPTIFLWYRQAAPSLFLKKRWWGRPSPAWKAGSLVCGPWPHSSSPPVAGTPRCARNCSHQASGAGNTIPPPAVRAPPFTQGRLIRCGCRRGSVRAAVGRKEKPRMLSHPGCGAGKGSRTLLSSLGSLHSTDELYLRMIFSVELL